MMPRKDFWPRVDKRGPIHPALGTACWLWTGGTAKRGGYGRVSKGRNQPREYAHRLSYEMAHGPIPAGLLALHRCDNPPCVNPEHLFAGTHVENMADMRRKNRAGVHEGERCNLAKLTDEAVVSIRERVAAGESTAVLRRELSLSRSAILSIARGLRWPHVGGPIKYRDYQPRRSAPRHSPPQLVAVTPRALRTEVA